MLRKIFGGAMVLSLTGAVVLGGVFAWGASSNYSGKVNVAQAVTHSAWDGNGNLIGPNDGVYRLVGQLELYNDSGSGYGLQGRNDGTVQITDVTDEPPGVDDGTCLIKDFAGNVTVGDTVSVIKPGAVQPVTGQVAIAVLPSASPSCQSHTVSFTATINANLVSLN